MDETARMLIFANPIRVINSAKHYTTTTTVPAILATLFSTQRIASTLTNALATTNVPLQQTLFAKILLEITRKL